MFQLLGLTCYQTIATSKEDADATYLMHTLSYVQEHENYIYVWHALYELLCFQ